LDTPNLVVCERKYTLDILEEIGMLSLWTHTITDQGEPYSTREIQTVSW